MRIKTITTMETSIYVNKMAIPAIEKFAADIRIKFTLGMKIMDGNLIKLSIPNLLDTTLIAFIPAIGRIEGHAERESYK